MWMAAAASPRPCCQNKCGWPALPRLWNPIGVLDIPGSDTWGAPQSGDPRLCCITRTGLNSRIPRGGFFRVATTTHNHPQRYPWRSLFRRMLICPKLFQKTLQQQALKSIRVGNHCNLSLWASSCERSIDSALAAIQPLSHGRNHADSMI